MLLHTSEVVSQVQRVSFDDSEGLFDFLVKFKDWLIPAEITYPGNWEFSREQYLNLLSESLRDRAIYSLPDFPGQEH